ncbi:MAG: hypothetical protein ACLUR5_01185 [Eubacterium ventriosum]
MHIHQWRPKALEKAGKALGYDVKMEQQGSMGQVNEITKEEAQAH